MTNREKELNKQRVIRFKENNPERLKEICRKASQKYRDKKRIRYCECGRELDKKCRYCSECAAVRRNIQQDIYRHNWIKNNPEKVKEGWIKQNAKKKTA